MNCPHSLDAGFGQFANILKWVCWKRQVYFGRVDAKGTSQTCPQCGTHTPKDLSVRVHNCKECKYTTNRDVAAAQVIVKRGVLAAGQAVSQIVCGGDGTGVSSANLVTTRRGRKPRSAMTWESPPSGDSLAWGGCQEAELRGATDLTGADLTEAILFQA